MEYFREEARLVARGHMTYVPHIITYANVVSCETLRIDLMIATLNDLKLKIADIMNTCVTTTV